MFVVWVRPAITIVNDILLHMYTETTVTVRIMGDVNLFLSGCMQILRDYTTFFWRSASPSQEHDFGYFRVSAVYLSYDIAEHVKMLCNKTLFLCVICGITVIRDC